MVREYLDVHGRRRSITFHSNPGFAQPFRDGYSLVTRWVDSAGYILTLPDKVWDEISYKDIGAL